MRDAPRQITLEEWDARYAELSAAGMQEPTYGGPLRRHVGEGDLRLQNLRYDNSAASLRLWNFLLTEEDRLHQARAEGRKIVGAMKDLGTVPVMAYSLPGVAAFYPDGAWWLPCIMEDSTGMLPIADSLGIDESFCPVRAMLGAFVTGGHFPIPDLLTCSVGATCDDFSAIAQRLNSLGYPILWWEIPSRRHPEPDEMEIRLPGGFSAPETQVAFVRAELERIRRALEDLVGRRLTEDALSAGIRAANRVRRLLSQLRRLTYTAKICPLPALEMLVAEMLAIHFCSDRAEARVVLEQLLREVRERVQAQQGVLSKASARVFWVNPVADLRVMNLLEECGGRICGTDYLFCHVLDKIPENLSPMEALARIALADPMVGTAADRAERICRDILAFHAEALVISRIPGASHCATEGEVIRDFVHSRVGIPVIEIEVPPVSDSYRSTLRTRLEALVEAAKERRRT
jgi:benzoyl-CoA reductase/2-hydroxyglutaryl-CoA dehydratase subunit BcrC/BadD/HgdB